MTEPMTLTEPANIAMHMEGGTTEALDYALRLAQLEMGTVTEQGQADFGSYTTADDMISECRRALLKHDLHLEPGAIEFAELPSTKMEGTRDGEPLTITYPNLWVERTWILRLAAEVDAWRAYRYSFPAVTARDMPIDKAIAACYTSGLKYFLRDLLQVPRGDYEMEMRDDRVEPQPKSRETPKPPKGKAADGSGGRK